MAGFSEDELAEQIVRSAAENVKAGVKVPEQPTRSKNRNFVSSAEAIRIIKLFVIRKLEGIEPAFDPQFKPAETGSYKECSDRENRSWRISERELGLSVDTTDFDVVGMNFDSITPDETYEVTDYIKDLFGSGTVPAYFKGSGARLDPCSLSTDKSIRTLETGKSSTWSAEQMRPDKLFSSNSPEYRDAIGAVVIDLDELRRGLENTNPQAEPGQKIVRDGDGGGPNAQYPTVVALGSWLLSLDPTLDHEGLCDQVCNHLDRAIPGGAPSDKRRLRLALQPICEMHWADKNDAGNEEKIYEIARRYWKKKGA